MNELEPLLRQMFDSSPDCLVITEVTADGRFRFDRANPGWERTTGLVSAQVAGRFIDEVLPAASADKLLARYRQCVQQGTTIDYEEELEMAGRPTWARVTLTPLCNSAGRVHRLFGVVRDVTERKQAQLSLAESERRYREIFENVSDSLYLLQLSDDGGLRYVDVNPAFERAACVPRAKLIGRDATPGLVPAQSAGIVAAYRRCIETATVVDEPMAYDLPAGRRLFHCTLVPVLGEGGGVHRIVGIARDITADTHKALLEKQRLRVYEALAQGAKLGDILDMIVACVEAIEPDFLASVMLLDEGGKHLRVSCAPRLCPTYVAAINGIAAADGVGSCGTAVARGERVITEDVELDPRWQDYRPLARAAGLASCWSDPIIDSAGKVLGTFGIYRRQPGRPSEGDLELIRQTGYLLATAIERQQADSLRRVRENEFSALVENSPDTVTRFDRDGRRTYTNPALVRLAGVPAESLLGLLPGEKLALAPLQALRFQEHVRTVLQTGQEAVVDVAWRSADGRTGHSQVRLVPESGPDATVSGVLAIGRDITALLVVQRQLSTLVESLPDAIMRMDTEGRMLFVNAAFAAATRRPAQDHVGRTLEDFNLDARGLVRAALRRAVAEAQPNVVEVQESEGERHFEVRHIPELDGHGKVESVLAVSRDITERRRAERLLQDLSFRREAAREEERKHIARELHDELGQFLSALRMDVSVLRLTHGPSDPVLRERAEGMAALVDRIIHVLRDLVASLRPAVLDLGIASALEWLASEFRARAGFACTLRVDEDRVALDAEQTTMVFRIAQESLTNVARHAQATQVSVTLERRGNDYVLAVRDNGRGFDPAVRDAKSFGLIGVKERAQMLGGRLDIRSSPGVSTTLGVTFPVARPALADDGAPAGLPLMKFPG